MNITTIDQYQPLARRTLKELPQREHFIHMGLGIIGEIGEFADAVKKNAIYLKPLDSVNLLEEGGDTFWYTGNLHPEIPVSQTQLQASFDLGYAQGRAQAGLGIFEGGLLVIEVMAQASMAMCNIISGPQNMEDPLERSKAETNVIIIYKALGRLYGAFNLDLFQSLQVNIDKLAKRYGDKFSEYAALNRDVDAERRVLEAGAGAVAPASAVAESPVRVVKEGFTGLDAGLKASKKA